MFDYLRRLLDRLRLGVDALEAGFGRRPRWMNALLVFCAYMALIYVPWDLFCKPVERDEEVWFGVLLRGWAAKLTEPLHWAVYAAGSYGLWYMKAWLPFWAIAYIVQIAFSMLVWAYREESSIGPWAGWLAAVPLAALAVALWRERARFGAAPASGGA